MNLTYLLLIVLVIVVVAGMVYILRPVPETNLSATPLPSVSPTDSTVKIPAASMGPRITPMAQTVHATLKTSMGDIDIELDGKAAPLTVGNFVSLAQANFYDGTTFHRVIPDFMIQGGDPLSKDQGQRMYHGTGGPGYNFPDEINDRKIVRGALAMANSGPNTNGSQFFIVVGPAFPNLDGKHTNFGTVTKGMEVADAISKAQRDTNDNPLTPVVIKDVVIQDLPQ
jgi:cyclophilin family peptidyl-prolyl cis-trans isomerase